jgi:hypothetical protein
MKRYKDNEDAKEKFVTDQRQEATKGAKKGPMASDGNPVSGDSSGGWGSMFDQRVDLAVERKQAGITRVDVSGADVPVAANTFEA